MTEKYSYRPIDFKGVYRTAYIPTQTRLGSIIEAIANVVIGFTINFTANMLIFPLFGFHISMRANFLMGLIYTVISIVRSYCLRRLFNRIRRWHK